MFLAKVKEGHGAPDSSSFVSAGSVVAVKAMAKSSLLKEDQARNPSHWSSHI